MDSVYGIWRHAVKASTLLQYIQHLREIQINTLPKIMIARIKCILFIANFRSEIGIDIGTA
jgi:hypothetical protein